MFWLLIDVIWRVKTVGHISEMEEGYLEVKEWAENTERRRSVV